MREKVANEITMKLVGKVADEDLNQIRGAVLAVLSNYEISERETALALYESFVPRFYETYLAMLRVNGRSIGTIKTYNFHLINFFLQLKRPITEIAAADIYEYLFALQSKGTVSNRTLDHIRLIINCFLEWAASDGYIDKNPCKSVKPINYTEKMRQPLTDYELELVRDACKTLKESAIVETMYSTGCRLSELMILRQSDIDLLNRTVMLFGKGGKYRKAFLNAKAELSIRKYLKSRKDSHPNLIVTDNKPTREISKASLERIVKNIGERANLDRRLSPHIFRHTFATNLLKRGASLEDVQKLLGHEKPSTTLIYTKIETSEIQRDHERYII